jgi:hypothetical protein
MVDPEIYDELRPDPKQPPVMLEPWQWEIWQPLLDRLKKEKRDERRDTKVGSHSGRA